MTQRTEFGYARPNDCACEACVTNCRHMSGYLIPADLERMRAALGLPDVGSLAALYLAASPGALVAKDGRAVRLPTLVPRRESSGRCVFLDAQDRCSIHAASPFGCAFFDAHMTHQECDDISMRGLMVVYEAWRDRAEYSKLWQQLAATNHLVKSPLAARAIMREAMSEKGESK